MTPAQVVWLLPPPERKGHRSSSPAGREMGSNADLLALARMTHL